MSENKTSDKRIQDQKELELSLQSSNKDALGVINLEFLLQSIGGLTKKLPLCLDQNLDTQSVVRLMLEKKVGSVLLINEENKVVGIFTERDYLKHFALRENDPAKVKIREVSTINPVTVPPETSIAYALNLMSHGGFRHLPVVDDQGCAIGVVSVRDVIDKISELLVQDMLAFDVG